MCGIMNHNTNGNGHRPDISLGDRVFIAVDLITRRRYFGKITNTARRHYLSRQTIYDLMDAVMPNLAALLGVTVSPLFRGKDADEELVVTATLLGETLSVDAVRGLAAGLSGCRRSPNFFYDFTRIAGAVAEDAIAEAARSVTRAALDETFPHDVLMTAADPYSMACLGLRLLGDVPLTGEVWGDFIAAHLPDLEQAVTDGGLPLKAGLAQRGVGKDADYTHASVKVGLAVKAMEKQATRAFQQLEAAENRWRALANKGQIVLFSECDGTEEYRQRYAVALAEAERLMDRWMAIEEAHRQVRQTYRYTRGDRLATPADAVASLQNAIQILGPHRDARPEIARAETYLRGILPGFGSFLTHLAAELDRRGPGAREAFLVVRRERQQQERRGMRGGAAQIESAWSALLAAGLDDDHALSLLLDMDCDYDRLLGQHARSSASVEHLHSRLAPYVAVSDRLSEARWNLVALRLNATPFAEGKRAGQSPFDLLGFEFGESWSETLVARMKAQFPASVAHLQAHGCLPSNWTPATESELSAAPLAA